VSNAQSIDRVIQTVQAEYRKHPRRSVNFRARVFWQERSGDLIEAPGLIRDVSASGLGIEVSQSLPMNKLLSVETFAGALQGIVRHVRQLSEGYLLGMEVWAASDGSNHQRSLRNLEIAMSEAEESR
jgi:hypothetical protein